jgi:anaerobic magnesium-protoporphyrin IX monomethyl ester cyclase
MMPVETIRGCPYKCTFCNSPDQITLYNNQTDTNFFRKKSIDLVYQELKHFKNNFGIKYNYFWADTFLSWNNQEFDEFCEMYSEIKLPFWMQTRPETLTDYKIERLAKVGLHRISFGIEHGNEAFRKKLLKRDWEEWSHNRSFKNSSQVWHSFYRIKIHLERLKVCRNVLFFM